MSALLKLDYFCVVAGAYVLVLTVRIARNRSHVKRWGSTLFWGCLGLILLLGRQLPPAAVGYGLLGMTALAVLGQVGAPPRTESDNPDGRRGDGRLGTRVLLPVLLVPAVAVAGTFTLDWVRVGGIPLAGAKEASQIALGLGCLVGLAAAFRLTRARPVLAVDGGGRLLELIGWTLLLPQVLAALGGVFTRSGVGDEVARLVASALPMQHPGVAVLAYCLAMAVFTMMLGNAFAAFPIITVGIGIPFVVKAHGGNPAILGALGMLSGYCGTLVTPMAANFNLVPVKLLELGDDRAIVRAQAPFAAAIWLFNLAVMLLCVYRF